MRFHQVFVGLLCLSFLSAFFLPAQVADPLRGVAKLFAPVAWPARKVGSALRDRLDPPRSEDHRDVADVKAENEELRALVLNLTGQLDEMRRINDELAELGDVRPRCTRFHVVGNDPSPNRESFSIPATTSDGVEARMAVLYSVGIVGRIDRVNALGAQVQLITDPKFTATARFARIIDSKPVMLQTSQPLVTGIGRGRMQIANIPLRETKGNAPSDPTAGIDVGDYVVLDDPDWDPILKNRELGRVESIGRRADAPTTAVIRVRPMLNLETLRDVMVMNKSAATAVPAAAKTANASP